MNMAASVAGVQRHENYKFLIKCHYKRSAKTTDKTPQVVDPPWFRSTGAAEIGTNLSNLGGIGQTQAIGS
jgi:hypothetical protein